MIVGVGRPEEPSCHRSSLATRRSTPRWLGGIVAGILIAPIHIQLPAQADEFDALVIYSEARPLNDRWQACAASYVRQRLQSQVSSQTLASAALRRCRPQESRLRRFFVSRIGKRSAENVIAVLRQRYQEDLAATINELRTRD
jgi:hypothetical protein